MVSVPGRHAGGGAADRAARLAGHPAVAYDPERDRCGVAYGELPAEHAAPAPTGTMPAPGLTKARLVRRFRVRETHTRVRRLAVVGAKPGMRIELRCRGRGCPRGRRIDVTRDGTVNLVRRARLRPRAVLVVRILEPGAIGRVERFRIRDDRAPSRRRLCLAPGATVAGPCA